MPRAGVLLAAGLATAFVLADFSAASGMSQESEEQLDGALRNCRSRGEAGVPIKMRVTGNDVRIGPLLLGNVRSRSAVGPADWADWPFVAKAPVLVPARSRVVLAIAPEATTRAAFQHRGGSVSAVRFTACFERVKAFSYRGTVGRTTFFPFAIAIRQRSACIPMEVRIDGRSSPVRRVVPIGRRTC
jgi:hypothetical protein